MKGLVNSVAYADGLRVGDVAIADISEVLKEPGRFVWVGLHEPDDEMLAEIQQEFSLHDLAVEDAARAHQRPKLERYGDSIFVVLRTAHTDASTGGIDFGETHLFVGANYVVSVRHGGTLPFAEVVARCEANPDLMVKGPVFVLYSIMDFIVDQYFPLVDTYEDKLAELEDNVFQQTLPRETTERIYQLKRDLIEVKRAIAPLVDVCNRLVRGDVPLVPEDSRVYFRDVYDHVIRINEMVDTLRELLSAALEANLSLVSVSQNEAMKRLAGWAAIVAVPTMIAGVYGMNFKFMPELDWYLGYPVALTVMVGACAFLYYKFKRSGWL
ncbi:MAG TPA: magnesium/cobalt transporter CorA [Methylomirabilota bacterium]|nr:magnesium/cobalt transporter CorA [Methylomirabilota bacterium]